MDNVLKAYLYSVNGDYANFREAIRNELTLRAAARIEELRPYVAQDMFGESAETGRQDSDDPKITALGKKVHDLPKGYETGPDGIKTKQGKRKADQ